MMSLWTFLSMEPSSISSDSMAADLESAVMAPLDQIEEAW